jgi:DNA-binding MarR family transcriptional regulator
MSSRRTPTDFFDTFGALRRAVHALGAEVYGELGSTQAKFLRMIGERAPISQADLARATATDPALTGRVLANLIERGWVARERSTEDRREYVLELTAAGRRMRDKVVKLRGELAARVVSVLDDRDLDDFDRVARKILDALRPQQ